MHFRQNKIVRIAAKTVTYGLCCIGLAVIIIMYTPLANNLSGRLSVKTDLQKADVIVVLGGGLFPNGELSWFSLMRTVKGVELYKRGYADKIIFTGRGDCRAMAKVAIGLGIPEQAIFLADKSTRTHEDALGTAEIMKENGLQTALLVTSATHMKRAMLCFRHEGIKFFSESVEPIEMYAQGPVDRLLIFKTVMREYLGLALYKTKGWI
jgi:uncharacterized SAM-binding protein YcdF (DUF218 family)